MGYATIYAAQKHAEAQAGQLPTFPGTLHMGAVISSFQTKGTVFTEVAASGYARKAITVNEDNFEWVNGIFKCIVDLVMVQATVNWGTVTGVFFADAPTAGNVWFYHTLTSPQVINATNELKLAANLFTVRFGTE